MDEIVSQCNQNMGKRITAFERDLARIRTGRASITMFDGVKVDYYGNPTPLNQVSSLSTPDARTIVVSPFEKNLMQEIEKAILKADLGVNPTNDGNIIRVPIPQLTEDRRKELAKSIKKMAEDAKVGIRQARKDANDKIKKAEKSKDIPEDESKRLQGDIQKETDSFIKIIEDKSSKKESEVMKV